MSYIYDLTDTWNNVATTFNAIKMNVTDTASAAGSALLDLQVGGVSQFKVSKAGAVTAVGIAIPTISSTDTLSNKTLSSPTVSGTIAGAATWSGTQTFGVGTGSPFVRIDGGSSTNNGVALVGRAAGVDQWVVGSYSGIVGGAYDADFTIYNAVNSGKAYIYDAGNKRQIVTTTASETLSNKTLSSPTLSGTISGAAAFASTVTVANNVSFRVTGTAADVRNAVKMTTADTIEFATTNNNVTLSGFTIAFITVAGTVLSADNDGLISVRNASNIALGTTTGTKIGTATNQKLGFFNATPVVQPTAVADATGAGDVVAQLNALLSRMRDLGLIAT